MNKIPNFNEFKGGANRRQSQRVNEANNDQFFKTYEETENWLIKMGVKGFEIDPSTLVVDGYTPIDLNNNNLTKLPVRFGETTDFIVSNNALVTLLGCPRIVNGDFDCSSNKITSLIGGPAEITGDYDCRDNRFRTVADIEYDFDVDGKFLWDRNLLSAGGFDL